MIIKYDVEKLKNIIKYLSELTGVAISVLDTEYNTLVHYSKNTDYCSSFQALTPHRGLCTDCDRQILEKCSRSKSPEHHLCHAGLYDFAMPITRDGIICGYIIMGRIRSVSSPMTSIYSFQGSEILYSELPIMSVPQIDALQSLMPNILFDNAIHIEYSSLLCELTEYLDKHLTENHSISSLCKRFHISKNLLYDIFYTNLGCTPCEYITQKRMSLAKKLLAETEKTVYEIAEETGIFNYTYFCKLFKRTMGITPSQYRKNFR